MNHPLLSGFSMHLYANTSKEFISDALNNRLAPMLAERFETLLHRKPPQQEMASWQNSLFRLAVFLHERGYEDQGIILEYQLPLSSLRADVLITGKDEDGNAQAVVVELKQWSNANVLRSEADESVTVYIARSALDVSHPSAQVKSYELYLQDSCSAFSKDGIKLNSCAFLHNLTFDQSHELYDAKHTSYLYGSPVFAGDRLDKFDTFLKKRVGKGQGKAVMDAIIGSKFAPSKKLLDYTAQTVEGLPGYILLDEQKVVFDTIFSKVKRASERPVKKTMFLVRGGPGTGKSVLALQLIGKLAGLGKNIRHLTGSKAFTTNLRKVAGKKARPLLDYFNFDTAGRVPESFFDALILDEAHRLRESSKTRFTKQSAWSGLPQIEEIVRTSKVTVFFIDDRQLVRPGEVGTSALIRETAERLNADLIEMSLTAQFRCGGADGFINWVDNTLEVCPTANVEWNKKDPYEVRVFDTVEQLDAAIRAKAANGNTARLAAGFCWKWSDPRPDGTLEPDVQVTPTWSMPWNARADGKKKLAAGIPQSDLWASDPGGIDQVGCVYTAQGFEFDFVGVIFGQDLRYDWNAKTWVGDKTKSQDTVVKRSQDAFIDLVKNTYRVLLTRGMKGCYIYFMDEGTRRLFESRMVEGEVR